MFKKKSHHSLKNSLIKNNAEYLRKFNFEKRILLFIVLFIICINCIIYSFKAKIFFFRNFFAFLKVTEIFQILMLGTSLCISWKKKHIYFKEKFRILLEKKEKKIIKKKTTIVDDPLHK